MNVHLAPHRLLRIRPSSVAHVPAMSTLAFVHPSVVTASRHTPHSSRCLHSLRRPAIRTSSQTSPLHTNRSPSTTRPLATAASPPPPPPSSSPSPEQSSLTPSTTPAPKRWKVRAVQDAEEDAIVGQVIKLCGWVRSVRDQKQFAFIDLNDGSSLAGLQLVVDAENVASYETVQSLSTGCSVSAVGEIIRSPGSGQTVEMKTRTLTLLGSAENYPLQKKRHSLEFLRSIAHLRPRTNSIAAMSRVRSQLAIATHRFFDNHGFVYLNSPIITASDCEGAGEMFHVTTLLSKLQHQEQQKKDDGTNAKAAQIDYSEDFFEKPAYLTVSGQLSAEAYATALSDVYTFGPTFRAENSNTSRHLAEFWMVEPEMAFATLDDDMDNAESYVKYVVGAVLDRCGKDIEFFDKFIQKGLLDKLRNVVDEPFERISYTEAIDILERINKKKKNKFEYKDIHWGMDLQSEHERYIAEQHFGKPTFIFNYPAAIKAFYMRNNEEDDGKTVQAMDLLVPGIGELIGGSAREERLDVLEKKLVDNGLDKETYWWYLDLRRYGSVPHAGYGLGFERLVQFVTGLENIRDVVPFPRYPGSAEF